MRDTVDVLIVGAGPVGLMLATELARDGVDALLIDRMAERVYFSKALGVSARTLEIFEDLGIAQDAIDAGVWITGFSVFEDGLAGPGADIPEGVLPFGGLALPQYSTERVLESCLHRHGGAVQYGWRLAGFTQDAAGVTAEVAAPDGATQPVRCRWLVGCDGAHSAVRSTLGLPFEGGHYPLTFVLADLEVGWDLPRGRFYRFNAHIGGRRTTLVAVPVHGSPRRYRLSTSLAEAPAEAPAGEAGPPTLEQVRGWMAPLLPAGTTLSNLYWSSTYRVSHRIVPAYSQGRVFLAGDAAHIHPPVGGQGMNTGLQDAHNLAWKLALACRGTAAPGLLDSYGAERHPVGMDVVENTSRAMNEALANRTPIPGMRETQLLIGYRGSPIVCESRGDAQALPLAAGDRAPDVAGLRRAWVGHAFRLRELIGRGRHVLLGLAGDEAEAAVFAELRAALRAALGEGAGGYAILPAGAKMSEREDIPLISDAGGGFAEAFGGARGTAWVIRPDGHVGWCSAAPSVAALQAWLSRIVG